MTSLTLIPTIGQLVRDNPSIARTLESVGIDYCCSGKRTLQEACQEKDLDYPSFLASLTQAPQNAQPAWLTRISLSDLCSHIVSAHHEKMRQDLPRIQNLLTKVLTRHADKHAHLVRVQAIFSEFVHEFSAHMAREERVLFPLITRMEATGKPQQTPAGTLADAIAHMESQHKASADALVQIRTLTQDFTPPDDACNTFRVLYSSLAELQADMTLHIHKENDILFPGVLAMEAGLAHLPATPLPADITPCDHAPATRPRPKPEDRFQGDTHFFDLAQAFDQLSKEPAPSLTGHRQMTLYHDKTTTIAIFDFAPGSGLKPHKAPGQLTIHLLSGQLDIQSGAQSFTLTQGQLLTIAPNIIHAVQAHQAGRMLITLHH
jgi:regulator of cell morphogenesis and NO signaling